MEAIAHLDYQQTPARGTARWAIASVLVGTASFILAIGLPLLARLIPGSGQTVGVTAVVFVGVVAIGGPPVGITLGALGLRPNMRRRLVAAFGIALNLALWALIVLMLFIPRSRTAATPATAAPTVAAPSGNAP